ncbi:MAG: ADP-ribosyl-(dinitrogen reductase) hydrolase [Shewanella sp.]
MCSVIISDDTEAKLQNKHGVSRKEAIECLYNRSGKLLKEMREEHQTTPPTLWFIAETNRGRQLKICLVIDQQKNVHIKTAYEPNAMEISIYDRFGS